MFRLHKDDNRYYSGDPAWGCGSFLPRVRGMTIEKIITNSKRYLQPPNAWVNAQPESRELLALCLKKLRGLNKVFRLWESSSDFVGPINRCWIYLDRTTFPTYPSQTHCPKRSLHFNYSSTDIRMWICSSIPAMSRLRQNLYQEHLESCRPSPSKGPSQTNLSLPRATHSQTSRSQRGKQYPWSQRRSRLLLSVSIRSCENGRISRWSCTHSG